MLLEDANKVLKEYIGAKNDLALSKSDKKLEELISPTTGLINPTKIKELELGVRQDMQARSSYDPKEFANGMKMGMNELQGEIDKEQGKNTKFKKIAQQYPKAKKPSDEVRREAANVFKKELEKPETKKDPEKYKELKKNLDIVKPKIWATVKLDVKDIRKLNVKDMVSKIRDRLNKAGSIGKNENSTHTPPPRARSSSQSQGRT